MLRVDKAIKCKDCVKTEFAGKHGFTPDPILMVPATSGSLLTPAPALLLVDSMETRRNANCFVCRTDVMLRGSKHQKLLCADCREKIHTVCSQHHNITCPTCCEDVTVRWCNRGHHFVSLQMFVESDRECYGCSWKRSRQARDVAEVLERRNSTICLETAQPVPIVLKTVRGTSARHELAIHRHAMVLNITHVLPLLRVQANTLVFPYVPALKFAECCSRYRLKSYMRQLVRGLKELHLHNIVHCDLKPDNILMSRRTGKLMIIDLGLSAFLGSKQLQPVKGNPLVITSGRGTQGYRAPEIVANISPCSPTSDMWAVGIILLCLLRGQLPGILDKSAEASSVCQLIGTDAWHNMVKSTPWKNVNVQHFPAPITLTDWRRVCRGRGNSEALSLLAQLLKNEPHRRLSAEQCLSHPFLR